MPLLTDIRIGRVGMYRCAVFATIRSPMHRHAAYLPLVFALPGFAPWLSRKARPTR